MAIDSLASPTLLEEGGIKQDADEHRSTESIDDLVDLKDRDIQKMPSVFAIVSILLKQRATKSKRLDS